MCDEGRFGWKYIHSEQRLALPEQRRGGKVVSQDWDVVLPAVRRRWSMRRSVAKERSRPCFAVDDGRRSVSAGELFEVALAEGVARDGAGANRRRRRQVSEGRPRQADGAGEVHDSRGEVPESPRRGSGAAALRGQRACRWATCWAARAAASFAAMYLVGGDPEGWINESQAAALDNVGTVIVQDLLPSPASRAGDVRAAERFVCGARRHVCESRRAGAGDSSRRFAARAKRSRTVASCGIWPGVAGC